MLTLRESMPPAAEDPRLFTAHCDRDPDPFVQGPFSWVLENPRPIEPVPYRGQLLLFEVPEHLSKVVSRVAERPAPRGPEGAAARLALELGGRFA